MSIKIRKPVLKDGKEIYKLVENSKVLDLNSEYLYLLQTTHFDQYCAVAIKENQIVGFVSGYVLPKDTDILFIWQVAVDSSIKGQGMAGKMIMEILKRDHLQNIKEIHTTISPSNKASQRVFEKLCEQLKGSYTKEVMFGVDHFHHSHEDEVLYKIQL